MSRKKLCRVTDGWTGDCPVHSHPWDERVAGQAINHTLLVYNDPSSAQLYHGVLLTLPPSL